MALVVVTTAVAMTIGDKDMITKATMEGDKEGTYIITRYFDYGALCLDFLHIKTLG